MNVSTDMTKGGVSMNIEASIDMEWYKLMPITTEETKLLSLVGGVGAIGGAMVWVFGQTLEHGTAETAWNFLPLSIFLGFGASIIFVFLVANTDRKDIVRLLALALLSGFFWKPVWLAGEQIIDKTYEERAAAAVESGLQLASAQINSEQFDEKSFLSNWHEITQNVTRISDYETRTRANILVTELAASQDLPDAVRHAVYEGLFSTAVLDPKTEGLLFARLTSADPKVQEDKTIRLLINSYLTEARGQPRWSENEQRINIYRANVSDDRTSKLLSDLGAYCNQLPKPEVKNIKACRYLEVERTTARENKTSIWRLD